MSFTKKLLTLFLTTSLTFSILTLHAEAPQEPYAWKSVPIVGGGFVDGIIFHPTEKNLRYARTDMGGCYRWNPKTKKWDSLLDWVPYKDTNLLGIESLAIDPNDPDALYLACGTYTGSGAPFGAILISHDRGKTFRRVDMPFRFGANENGRGNGERMMVDPANGNIIYLGTRHDGLWRTQDKGLSWEKVDSFPFINEKNPYPKNTHEFFHWYWQEQGAGLIFVQFDPDTAQVGKGSPHIIVGASFKERANLFESFDFGQTWVLVPNHSYNLRITDGCLASDGSMYLTYGDNPGPGHMFRGLVKKWNMKTGEWTDVTPEMPTDEKPFGYADISVDPQNPQQLIVSSFHQPKGSELYRSIDGGKTWFGLLKEGHTLFDYRKAPYVEPFGVHWMFDIEIDPFDSNHAIFTTGYGGHETYNLTDADSGGSTIWSIMSDGIEETVALDLLSPPKGPPLITAVGDYNGFVHWNLDEVDPTGGFKNPLFNNTESIDCAWQSPNIIVRVGRSHRGGNTIAYTTDFGKTWHESNRPYEDASRGFISVSSDGKTWFWTPMQGIPYRTTDLGKTWTKCDLEVENLRIISDRVNPKKFYAYQATAEGGALYTSIDAGISFTETLLNIEYKTPFWIFNVYNMRGDFRGAQDKIYSYPLKENELWLPSYDGLYLKSSDSNEFKLIEGIDEIHAFGFGKSAPGADYMTLYALGTVNGTRGIYRSIDKGHSWTLINDDAHQWGNVLYVIGDPKVYGRVYVGTHGRGTFYGVPENSQNLD